MFYEEYNLLSAISGILICYGPLAVTIIGFIAFAALTDGDARRTYLRHLSSEEPEYGDIEVKVKQRLTAKTPSGAKVTLDPTVTSPASVAKKEPGDTEIKQEAEDDLTIIKGIGKKMSEVLKAANIKTFLALSQTSEDDLRQIIEEAGLQLAPTLDTWAEQAKYAASGDMEGLKRYQKEIDMSGRNSEGESDDDKTS
jgi:large subunit ribosomal protein L17